jgi:hypothetical protein
MPINELTQTKIYDRIRFIIPDQADRVIITGCISGDKWQPVPYKRYEPHFTYDKHGYEAVTLSPEPENCVSFTAVTAGEHILCAFEDEKLVFETRFLAVDPDSDNHGYVGVSLLDPRYFAYSDGTSYIPIGLNLVGCDYDAMPAGIEHFKTSETSMTTGLLEWGRWFGEMKKAGVNYCRLWLSSRYTEARTEIMGIHDPVPLARFEALIELARKNNIKLKLCFEHWRTFADEKSFFYRRYVDPATGRKLENEDDWFAEPIWNERWITDIMPYLARCQNDPVVFAWELWNEIDCGNTGFETVTGFTSRMLKSVKTVSPRNLVVNSLGSFDGESKQERQDRFRDLPEMDFQQVHRYLDQGAPMVICRVDPVEFSIDAINRTRRPDKPVILTETGAVNDRHTAPFRFYNCDHNGLIFHDVTYPALFAGAAGSGHIWHWSEYVEPKNLWKYFRPLVSAFEGIQMDAENFKSRVVQDDKAWILVLEGDSHILIFVRNKKDRWDHVLRDGMEPGRVKNLTIPVSAKSCEAYWLMEEKHETPVSKGGKIHIEEFVHGCIIRAKKRTG